MFGQGNYTTHFRPGDPLGPPPPPIRPPPSSSLPLPPFQHIPPPPPPFQHAQPPFRHPFPLPGPPPPASVNMGMTFLPPPPQIYSNAPIHNLNPLPPPPPRTIAPPPPPLQGQAAYGAPPRPPPGMQHVPAPPPPAPSGLNYAIPPPLPPPSPPPPPPASPPPPLPSPPPAAPSDNETYSDEACMNGFGGAFMHGDETGVDRSADGKVGEDEIYVLPSPPAKPSDEVVRSIETLCRFIAKAGPHFESVARSKEAHNPRFAFLYGGEPGSEGSIGYEYFQWMKRKYLSKAKSKTGFEQNISPERFSERRSSPQASPDEVPSATHTDSDMDMEDDEDQADKGTIECHNELYNLSMLATYDASREVDHPDEPDEIFRHQPDNDISECHTVESGRSVVSETHDGRVLLPFPGNNSEDASRVIVKNESPFKHIQDYASDETFGDDMGNCFISDVSPVRESPIHATSTPFCKEVVEPCAIIGKKDALETDLVIHKESSPPNADTAQGLEHPASSLAPYIPAGFIFCANDGTDRSPEGADKFNAKREESEEYHLEGVDHTQDQHVVLHQPALDTKEDPAVLKVDEFGRMVRESASDSESDEHPYKERHAKRERSWSRSRSPSDIRRSRSPRRRADKRSRSGSFSPKRRRRRSRSPSELKRPGDFGRREHGDPPRCIFFMRGRCLRGSSCRYLHIDSGERWAKSRQHRTTPYGSDKYPMHNHHVEEDIDYRNKVPETYTSKYARSLDDRSDKQLPLGPELVNHSIQIPEEEMLGTLEKMPGKIAVAVESVKYPTQSHLIEEDVDYGSNVPETDTLKYSKMSLDDISDEQLPLGSDLVNHTIQIPEEEMLGTQEFEKMPSKHKVDVVESSPLIEEDVDYGSNVPETDTLKYSKMSLDDISDEQLPLGSDLVNHTIQIPEEEMLGTQEFEKMPSKHKVDVVESSPLDESRSSVDAIQDHISKELTQVDQVDLALSEHNEGSLPSQKEVYGEKLENDNYCPVLTDSLQSQSSVDDIERESGSTLEGIKLDEPFISLATHISASPSHLEPSDHAPQNLLSEAVSHAPTPSLACENLAPGAEQVQLSEMKSPAEEETAAEVKTSAELSDIGYHLSNIVTLQGPVETSEVKTSTEFSNMVYPWSNMVSLDRPSGQPAQNNELPLTSYAGPGYHLQPYEQKLPPPQPMQPPRHISFTPVMPAMEHVRPSNTFHSINEPPKAAWINAPPPQQFVGADSHITARANLYPSHFPRTVEPTGNEFQNQNARHQFPREPTLAFNTNSQLIHDLGVPDFRRDEQPSRPPLLASQMPYRVRGNYPLGFTNPSTQEVHPPFQSPGLNVNPPRPLTFHAESSARAPQPVYGMQYPSGVSFSSNQRMGSSNNPPLLRYPLNVPEKQSESWTMSTGMPLSSSITHYNPFASTFESSRVPRHASSFPSSQPPFSDHGLAGASAQTEYRGSGTSFARSGEVPPAMPGTVSHYSSLVEASSMPSGSQKQHYMESSTGAQYDPLLDSLETSNTTRSGYTLEKDTTVADTNKSLILGNIPVSAEVERGVLVDAFPTSVVNSKKEELTEMAADTEVGTVEDESPLHGEADDLPNPASGEIDIDKIPSPGKSPGRSRKSKDSRSMKLFKAAIANFVKELLKPSWRQGNMSKEAFKTIVRKTVEKVSSTIPPRHIPKTQDKINHYVETSQRKLTKLVRGYVEKYVKI